MIAPGLDANLDHELNRGLQACDVVTQSDSVGLSRAATCGLVQRDKVAPCRGAHRGHVCWWSRAGRQIVRLMPKAKGTWIARRSDSPVSRAGLRLEHVSAMLTPCPFAA